MRKLFQRKDATPPIRSNATPTRNAPPASTTKKKSKVSMALSNMKASVDPIDK